MKESTSYYVILGIISFGNFSGYDIRKKIEKEIGYFYKVSNGQIYPILKKLVLQKNATFVAEKSDGKPDRKVYSITDKGREVLKEWMNEDVVNNELLLKLYFGSNEPISRNIKIVEDFKKSKAIHLKTYDDIAEHFNLSTINSIHDYYSYFTLLYGQMITKAYIDWCDEVIGVLEKMNKSAL